MRVTTKKTESCKTIKKLSTWLYRLLGYGVPSVGCLDPFYERAYFTVGQKYVSSVHFVHFVHALCVPCNRRRGTKAGFPSNATHETHVTNATKARKVRNERSWRSWRNGCSNNYPQPPPLLGRLLLQFNAAQQKNSNHLQRVNWMSQNKSQLI